MPGDEDILYRANIAWSLQGSTCLNSFFFRSKPGNPFATIIDELHDLADDIQARLIAQLRGVISQDCQLLNLTVFNLNGTDFREDVRNFDGLFGQVGESAAPSVLSAVISWRTQYRGRRVHGRTYVPGVPVTQINGARFKDGYQVLLDNAAGNILGWFGQDGGAKCWLVCYSRKNGTHREPGPPPFISYSPLAGIPVDHHVIDAIVNTQRHRLAGRGM